MAGYIPLPAFRAPGPLDFSGLNQGIEAVGQKLEKNRLLDQSRQIGSAIQSGDYSGGAAKAFEYGDLDTGLNLANTQRQIEQDQFNRNRLLASDKRAAAAEGRSSEIHGLNVEKTREDIRSSLITRTAGIAQRIRSETDPQRKSALVQSFVNAHPKLKSQLDAYNFDPANPDPTLDMIIAEARGLLGGGSSELMSVAPGNTIIDKRTGQPVYQAPPKPGAPMNATSMKEVFEADESAVAAENVLSSLDRALQLNEQAYSGPGAKTRGYLTSLYGAEGGVATEELQNVVTSQVLENLKATFGGMPTEGERQVLLDVQGSVDKSPEVRKRIFERAMETARRRLEYNRQKAEGIRSGSYFQPGGANAQAAPQSAQPSPFPEYPNAQQAPDGNWYVEQNGQYFRIDQ